ncbi:hypothetical protein P8452_51354 [Trifolium repens]|nr:hypothetical protein P8452_51354 [Trifolium repens]
MLLILLLLINSSSSDDECTESSCGHNQPIIRFPFQLIKDSQDQCVYPKFCLHCTENKNTMLLLPTPSGPVEFFVPQIDYELNLILISDPENCLTKKLLKLNSSSFLPYRFYSESKEKISFFNCSSVRKQHLRNLDLVNQNSQDMTTCPIYASSSDESVIELDLESCTKMFDVSRNFSAMDLRSNQLSLSWPIPNCTVCSAKGKKCRWKNNATKGGGGDIECFVCNVERKTNPNFKICYFRYCRFNSVGVSHHCFS